MLRRFLPGSSGAAPAKVHETPRAALEHFPNQVLAAGTIGQGGAWPFPAHLDNPDCRWLQALKHIYSLPITFPASLSPEAGQLLHALALNIRPTVVVETGTFLGISTIWLAAALEVAGGDGVVHCIDDFRPIRKGHWRTDEMLEGREARVREHIERAGLAHRVVIHRDQSVAGIARVAAAVRPVGRNGRGGGVQFAFLDADHSVDGVRREFEALEPALDSGGYVVAHDTFPEICNWKGPRTLMETVNTFARGRYESMDFYLAPTNFGMGVLRRVG